MREHAQDSHSIRQFGARQRQAVVPFFPGGGRFARIRLPLTSDDLERRLNGEQVTGSNSSWRIDVYGIVEAAGHRWIQIGLDGTDQRSVLLRLAYMADDADVRNVLESWVENPSAAHGGILPVSCH